MFEIEIRRTISAAHQLKGYDGDCRNLHGHNYEIIVALRGDCLDKVGIAMDFKVLKHEVDELLKNYDHHNLSELPEFADCNPTSEILSRSLYRHLSDRLNCDQIKVHHVRVEESASSAVTYFED